MDKVNLVKIPFSSVILIQLFLAVSLFALNVTAVASTPATITVPDNYPTIQAAINAASAGDTVYVRAATYVENLVVNKTLSLVGEGTKNTIIDGGGSNNNGDVIKIVADNVNVTGFTIRNCGIQYSGIRLESNYSKIAGNNIAANPDYSIDLYNSDYNVISGNNITNNYIGVYLTQSSSFNTFSGNTIANNSMWGVGLYTSSGNSFFHNNFINNTEQVNLGYMSNVNSWDDGYPSGGNYWSDYVSRYPGASEIDASGIWNTPYTIDSNNTDRYPLKATSVVIPELPSFPILLFSMTATLAAILAVRRKQAKHRNYPQS